MFLGLMYGRLNIRVEMINLQEGDSMKKLVRIFFVFSIFILCNNTTAKASERINNEYAIEVNDNRIEGEVVAEGEDEIIVSYFIEPDIEAFPKCENPISRAWVGYSIKNSKVKNTKTNFSQLISSDV